MVNMYQFDNCSHVTAFLFVALLLAVKLVRQPLVRLKVTYLLIYLNLSVSV